MLPLDLARLRISAVLRQIDELGDSDFPYAHSFDALELLKNVFKERRAALDGLHPNQDPELVHTVCSESLLQLFKFLPLLGFILRSTNVRNSFEVFGPLLRLAKCVVASDVKLVVSSEWAYSPHVYNPINELPNYILLGFPAPESGNPLLLPLAGHEFGHTAWQTHELAAQFETRTQEKVDEIVRSRKEEYQRIFDSELDDLFLSQDLRPAYTCALKQVEESFCDFLGVKLFSESYFYAFAYLVAPAVGERSGFYPALKDRVSGLLSAAEQFKVDVPGGFDDWFSEEASPARNDKEEFLLKLADSARQSLIPELVNEAGRVGNGVPTRSQKKIDQIINSFRLLTPASSVGDLPNILNAAWKALHDKTLWGNTVENKVEMLNELVLKSIEILEYEERTENSG